MEEQGTWAAQKHSEAGYGRPVDRGVWTAKTVKRPRQQPAHPQYANYWAPLTRKRHPMPHSAQSQHTNYGAPRTRKRHQQEHRPQRPTERSDPTQHAKGRTGDRPGPRKETATRRNVTQGGVLLCSAWAHALVTHQTESCITRISSLPTPRGSVATPLQEWWGICNAPRSPRVTHCRGGGGIEVRNFSHFSAISQFFAIFRNFSQISAIFRNFSAIFHTSRFSDCLPTLVQNNENFFFFTIPYTLKCCTVTRTWHSSVGSSAAL